MRLTIDKVNIWSRPLFMYTVPACFNWYLKRKVYAKMGMLVVSVFRGIRRFPS